MTTIVEITVDQLRDRLAHHEPVTILDVRPSDERAEWSIPGSQHIDAYERLRAGDEHVLDEFVAPDGGSGRHRLCGWPDEPDRRRSAAPARDRRDLAGRRHESLESCLEHGDR